MATQDQRTHALAIMQLLLDHSDQIGYVKLRPMATASLYEQELVTALHQHPGQKVISPDCSECVHMICRMSGLQSPSGPLYPYSSGQGNSATAYNHLGHYTNAQGAQLAALVAFGPGGDDHLAMVKTPDPVGGNPILFSHGGPGGPIEVSLNDYVKADPTEIPVTFLNIVPL